VHSANATFDRKYDKAGPLVGHLPGKPPSIAKGGKAALS
jgi:hypothetical protein